MNKEYFDVLTTAAFVDRFS